MGNGEWGMGNGEWGMGNGEWGMGCKNKSLDITTGESSNPALFLCFTTPEAKKLFKRI